MNKNNTRGLFRQLLSLVLALAVVCSLAMPAMAAEVVQNPDNLYPGETVQLHVSVQTTSQTPVRSEAYSVIDPSTGVENFHVVSSLETYLQYPKWVLYSYGNNGTTQFQMKPRFVPISMNGELGYQFLLDIDFFGSGEYANTVIYSTTLGDNDEVFTVTNYYGGITPGMPGEHVDKVYEEFKIVRITNKDVSKVKEAGLTKGNTDNDDTRVNLGDGLDAIQTGQIEITKTVSGLEQVDWLKDGIYYIEVTGISGDLSYYKLNLNDAAKTVSGEDTTYKWIIPVIPSNTENAYEVKEHTYYIPGYTCTANYEVVHGDYSMTKGEGADDETKVTVYTSRYGTVEFVNRYVRNKPEEDAREYVIDFGLPVDFALEDLKLTMQDENGNTIPITDRGVQVTKLEIDADATYTYGNVEFISDNESTEAYDPVITYIPNSILNGAEKIPVKIWVNGRETEDYDFDIMVYPATLVFYEEEFVTFKNSGAADGGFGVWSDAPRTRNKQMTEALGDLKNIYGYDPAYAEGSAYSMNSAKQVVVNEETGKKGTAPTAAFTFTGTGFDIISLTDNTCGAISVTVKKGGEVIRKQMVNNFYGYTYNAETGEWAVCDSTDANALYQIPVIKMYGLEHGEYEVTVEAAYMSAVDQTDAEGYTFLLDAIRIYDPMNSIDDKYAQDGEDTPQYKTIRDLLVTQESFVSDAEITGSVFIDGIANGSATVSQYTHQGPNNEVYLAEDQAIAFQLQVSNISDIKNLHLHIGAKLVKGEQVVLNLGSEEFVTLKTATNMYYDLGSKLNWMEQNGVYTATVILSNKTDGSIVSLTNLKLTGDATFYTEDAPVLLSVEETPVVRMMISRSIANSAVATLNGSQAPEIPVDVFTPDMFEITWNTCSAGGYATLTVNTSMDVETLEVDGMVFTNVVVVPTVEIVNSQPVMRYHKMWTMHIQMMTSGEHICQIVAYNAEGTSSEAYETSVTIY